MPAVVGCCGSWAGVRHGLRLLVSLHPLGVKAFRPPLVELRHRFAVVRNSGYDVCEDSAENGRRIAAEAMRQFMAVRGKGVGESAFFQEGLLDGDVRQRVADAMPAGVVGRFAEFC